MGHSRLVMVAGITVIVGLYTLGLQRPGAALQSVAVGEGVSLQTSRIARAGVGLGLTRLEALAVESTEVAALPLMGGTLSYSIAIKADHSSASIVSRGSYRGLVLELSGRIDEVSPGRWVLRQEHWQRVGL